MNKNDTSLNYIRTVAAGAMILALAVLPGCATKEPGEPVQLTALPPQDDPSTKAAAGETHDYLEPINRGVFKVNEVIDGVLIAPVAHIYLGLMPEFGQTALKNIIINLNSPVVFLNSVLQADVNNAGYTLERFVVNSTVGVAGAFDVASSWGIPKAHKKDFGQTMGVYGTGTGTYIVIPVLGPSDARDAFGLVVDIFTDPLNYILTTDETLVRDGVEGVVKRADFFPVTNRVYRDSLDPYATFRSIYLQNRQKMVKDYLTY